MKIEDLNIHPDWLPFFKTEFEKDYMKELFTFLNTEEESNIKIFPVKELWFNAFSTLSPNEIKCTLFGQDPYMKIDPLINAPQAMGLSFSVPKGAKIPPSLRNIYKELNSDIDMPIPSHGDISSWSTEGVFMLNASLTVEEAKAGSHLKKGWHQFTKAVTEYLSSNTSDLVFLSWGNFAHKCCEPVDIDKHYIVKTSHPSPLGATKGSDKVPAFLGSKCFSKVNELLLELGKEPINWNPDK